MRAVIVQPEVETQTLADGKAAYIKLNGFSDRAAADFDAAVSGAVERGEKQVLVDLRGNPGGLVTAARDVASQFLPDGTIFWEEDSSGNLTETTAKPGGAATDPSIQRRAARRRRVRVGVGDRRRARSTTAGGRSSSGSKTFGKGTVQQWTQLEDDSGGFRLTIAKWLTPDKTWVHGVGITPDVVVTDIARQAGRRPGHRRRRSRRSATTRRASAPVPPCAPRPDDRPSRHQHRIGRLHDACRMR